MANWHAKVGFPLAAVERRWRMGVMERKERKNKGLKTNKVGGHRSIQ